MVNRLRIPWSVAAFTAAYLVAFGGMAIAQQNAEFVFYLVVMLVLVGMVYAVHRRVRFSGGVLWLLSVWGLLHMAGGNVPIPASLTETGATHAVLYSLKPFEWLPRYDQVTHTFGFFVATLASHQALRCAAEPPRIDVGWAAACGLMGMGFGALNEVVEFTAVLTLPDTNVGGYMNTGWDMVSNMIGALIGAAVVLLWGSPRRA